MWHPTGMKHGKPCPKCDAVDCYVIDEAKIPDYQTSDAVAPMTLTAAYASTGQGGFFGAKQSRIPVRIEAVVCAGCAYTELYAKDLDVLQRFARSQLGGVRREGGG